ncbi:MAG: hypothetical protein RBR81_12875, partial [Bacteroidales bacterium]|nr:hypothetical protein [Bacteroidales bacterium]
MRKLLLFIFCSCFIPLNINAGSLQELLKIFDNIKARRTIIQNTSTAFLLTSRQLESFNISEEQDIKVINQLAPVRESDLITAEVLIRMPEGTVLPVLKKDGDWVQVRLPDFRNGWIHEDDVRQIFDEEDKRAKNRGTGSDEYYETRLLAENFFLKFNEAFQETGQLISVFEKKYQSLSSSEQRNADKLVEGLNKEREIINLARAYVNHYHEKLPPLQIIQSGKTSRSKTIGYDGTATVRFGSAVYESGRQISETTSDISLSGNIVFNPQSRLSLQMNHSKDVIRTPYTSSNVGATYYHEASGGTRLNTSISYQDYGDIMASRNSYRNVGAGMSVEHALKENIRIQGDVQAQSKKYYDTEDGNDLQGVQFNTFLDYNGKKALFNAGIRGRLQSSEKAFLDYSRIIPNIRFTYKTAQNNWSVYGEAEQMAYGTAGQANDFNRIRLDLEASNRGKRTQITAINKSFPNNERFNNLKIKILAQKIQRSEGRNGRSTGYLEYTFHTSDSSVSG